MCSEIGDYFWIMVSEVPPTAAHHHHSSTHPPATHPPFKVCIVPQGFCLCRCMTSLHAHILTLRFSCYAQRTWTESVVRWKKVRWTFFITVWLHSLQVLFSANLCWKCPTLFKPFPNKHPNFSSCCLLLFCRFQKSLRQILHGYFCDVIQPSRILTFHILLHLG